MAPSSTISKDEFDGANRRACPREPLKWVVLSYFDKNNWGQILDISERGMLLEFAHLPPVRQRITFALQVMGSAPACFRERGFDKVLTGEVLWTREFERLAGVQFVDLGEQSRQQIRQWLSMETSGSAPAEKETDVQEEEVSSQEASALLPCASGALGQGNGGVPDERLDLFESADDAHPELWPPFGEEIVELPASSNENTFADEVQREYKPASHPRMTRVALIGVSSGLAILALAAGARIIPSRKAREAGALEQIQNPVAEAARRGSVAPVAGSPSPFLVEVLDANNRRWMLWFVENGPKNEVNEVASKARSASSPYAPRARTSERREPAPSTKSQEQVRFTLAAPKINRSRAEGLTMDGRAAPALEAEGTAPPGGAMVSILAGRPIPVPPERIPAVGGDVHQARLIRSVPPEYPAQAKTRRVAGDVTMDALIDATGKVKEVKVVSGPLLLQRAAEDALRQWKYEPARLDGQAVAMHLSVTMKFRIP